MENATAVVVGGGLGGLAAAVALRRVGWRVTVLEQAAEFAEIGAGIALLSNGLRCLDRIGLGDPVREDAHRPASVGVRTAAGRWLTRVDGGGAELQARIGSSTVVVHRAELHTILRDALPPEALLAGVVPTGILGGEDGGPVEVRFRHHGRAMTLRADMVVGADGVHSWVRAQRWLDQPTPVYSGSTTWRAVATPSSVAVTDMTLSWGTGSEFGAMPMIDGRTYWYAAVNAPEGARSADELGELRRRFASWHRPIPDLLAETPPEAVVRHDIYRLPTIDRYARGSVVLLGDAAHAMTPNIGQGGGQAFEDAIVLAAAVGRAHDVPEALAHYDHRRRPRTQRMSRAATRQLRVGQQVEAPIAVAVRNFAVALLPGSLAMRVAARYGRWSPPVLEHRDRQRCPRRKP